MFSKIQIVLCIVLKKISVFSVCFKTFHLWMTETHCFNGLLASVFRSRFHDWRLFFLGTSFLIRFFRFFLQCFFCFLLFSFFTRCLQFLLYFFLFRFSFLAFFKRLSGFFLFCNRNSELNHGFKNTRI